MVPPIRVAVTGAAGQIAYSLLFRLASGEVFGAHQPVVLNLLEITPAMGALEGVVMELNDCAFPTLAGITLTDQAAQAFDQVNWALLVGSRPRGPGMERADLIKINGPIFVGQGQALNRAAADVRVAVVGNPCNTNAMIALNNSDLPRERFSAMMRLDQNRSQSLLAHRANVPLEAVTQMVIWGNHSNNQYPDYENALIHGVPVPEVITDQAWLRDYFIKTVQNRGAQVIKARNASSAASAANALIDHVRSLVTETPDNTCYSAAVCSRGDYGVDEGLVCGLPLVTKNGAWQLLPGLTMSPWAQEQFRKVLDELRQERELVKDLLAR